jgi:hypothetical protein
VNLFNMSLLLGRWPRFTRKRTFIAAPRMFDIRLTAPLLKPPFQSGLIFVSPKYLVGSGADQAHLCANLAGDGFIDLRFALSRIVGDPALHVEARIRTAENEYPSHPAPHRKAAKIRAGEDRLDQDRPSSNTAVLVKPGKPIARLQPDHIDQDQFEIRTLKNSNHDKGLESRTFHEQPLYSVQAMSACTIVATELLHYGK